MAADAPDPIANTAMFRAFADGSEAAPKRGRTGLLLGGAVVAVLLLALLGWLVLG